jgi:hypothetical protein
MKKKLLVLLITVASTMMPNLASAVAVDVGDICMGDPLASAGAACS